MAAVYPYQYKSFPTHHDLTDDVEASDINNLQDEVAAIQQTLGITPQYDKSLKMATNTWPSVASRLDAIQRGHGLPAVFLYKSSASVKRTTTGGAIKVYFPAPSYDPEHLYNGSSITANRSGWWIVTGRVIWNAWTPYNKSPYEDRELDIWIGGGQVATVDNVPSPDGNTHQSLTYQNWVNAGEQIDLRVYPGPANVTLSLAYMHLSACMIRER